MFVKMSIRKYNMTVFLYFLKAAPDNYINQCLQFGLIKLH